MLQKKAENALASVGYEHADRSPSENGDSILAKSRTGTPDSHRKEVHSALTSLGWSKMGHTVLGSHLYQHPETSQIAQVNHYPDAVKTVVNFIKPLELR